MNKINRFEHYSVDELRYFIDREKELITQAQAISFHTEVAQRRRVVRELEAEIASRKE